MKLFTKFSKLIEKTEKMSQKDMANWKTLMIFAVVIDLFGVYWYLDQKKLAIFILLVLLSCFTFLLFYGPKPPKQPKIPKENKKEVKPKMSEEENQNEEIEEQSEEEQSEGLGMNLDFGDNFDFSKAGLPSADEVQDRLDKSLGTMDFRI